MNLTNSTGENINDEFSVLMDVIECIIVIFAITGNVFVIIAHLKDPLKLFQTSSSQFILNIAVVDLLAAIITTIMLVDSFISGKLTIPHAERFISSPILLAFPSYFVHSVERFCSVAFPLWHRARVTICSCRKCLLVVWFFHITYEAVSAVFGDTVTNWTRLVYVLLFFISTQVFYLATVLSLKKQNHQMIARQDTGENSTSNNPAIARAIKIRLLNEKQFVITISIICLFLALTVLPSIIYYQIGYLLFPEAVRFKPTVKIITLVLKINFMINPLIYLWRFGNYRKTLKVLCCSCE